MYVLNNQHNALSPLASFTGSLTSTPHKGFDRLYKLGVWSGTHTPHKCQGHCDSNGARPHRKLGRLDSVLRGFSPLACIFYPSSPPLPVTGKELFSKSKRGIVLRSECA